VARGRVMEDVARAGEPGGMLAVGSDRDGAQELADDHELTLANENSPQQFVLSGPLARIEEAEAATKGSGMRAKKLAVAGAFHTEAMSSGVEAFRAELDEIEFRPSEAQVVSSTTADFFGDDVRDALAASLTSPIRWTAVLAKLEQLGVTRYLDVGPGKVLAGLVRRTLPDSNIEIVTNREPAHA
jgi:[acyl-carrier-protein] S-malonyltransferase